MADAKRAGESRESSVTRNRRRRGIRDTRTFRSRRACTRRASRKRPDIVRSPRDFCYFCKNADQQSQVTRISKSARTCFFSPPSSPRLPRRRRCRVIFRRRYFSVIFLSFRICARKHRQRQRHATGRGTDGGIRAFSARFGRKSCQERKRDGFSPVHLDARHLSVTVDRMKFRIGDPGSPRWLSIAAKPAVPRGA